MHVGPGHSGTRVVFLATSPRCRFRISTYIPLLCPFSFLQLHQGMVNGLMKLVIGRFMALGWHGIATFLLIFGKTPLIQIELDPRLTIDLRDEQFENIDTWWVFNTLARYSVDFCVSTKVS